MFTLYDELLRYLLGLSKPLLLSHQVLFILLCCVVYNIQMGKKCGNAENMR